MKIAKHHYWKASHKAWYANIGPVNPKRTLTRTFITPGTENQSWSRPSLPYGSFSAPNQDRTADTVVAKVRRRLKTSAAPFQRINSDRLSSLAARLRISSVTLRGCFRTLGNRRRKPRISGVYSGALPLSDLVLDHAQGLLDETAVAAPTATAVSSNVGCASSNPAQEKGTSMTCLAIRTAVENRAQPVPPLKESDRAARTQEAFKCMAGRPLRRLHRLRMMPASPACVKKTLPRKGPATRTGRC